MNLKELAITFTTQLKLHHDNNHFLSSSLNSWLMYKLLVQIKLTLPILK